MKAIVLHGENTVASREKLNSLIDQLKEKDVEIIRLDEPKKDELILKSKSQGLFEENKCLIVEGYLASAKDFSGIPETDTIYWEKRKLPPTTLKKVSGFSIQEFPLPSSLFPLLDNVFPGNTKRLITLYEGGKETLEAELVFAMLTRTTRMLLWAKIDPDSLVVPGWQRGKLLSQANKFTEQELRNLNSKLLEIDRASKTSKLPENLSSSLELLFASL